MGGKIVIIQKFQIIVLIQHQFFLLSPSQEIKEIVQYFYCFDLVTVFLFYSTSKINRAHYWKFSRPINTVPRLQSYCALVAILGPMRPISKRQQKVLQHFGAQRGARTQDPEIKSIVLYRLIKHSVLSVHHKMFRPVYARH